jgi:raffinose/stachyose/melibiose transport system substrate-binding protein
MNKKLIDRREFLRLSGLTAAGLIAAGCASAPPPAASTTAKQPAAPEAAAPPATVAPTVSTDATTVTWWGEPFEDERRAALLEEFVGSFEASHPTIRVDYTFQEDIDRVLRTAVQAGAAPDVLVTPGAGFVLEYVRAGHVLDLTEMAKQYQWQDKLLGWAYDSGVIDGKLYSLPLTFESMLVVYNKTLFDKMGWTVPTNRTEIETIAEAAKKEGIYPFAYGNSDWKPATEHLIGMFYDHVAGADNVYKALTGQKQWTDPEFVDAMELMNDWFQKGYYSGSIDNYHALTWNDFWPILATGKAAMMMVGTWGFRGAVDAFKASGQEWDWFPMPSLQEGVKPVYALATGTTLSINAKSPHPKEAAEAMDWVYNDKKRAMRIASNFAFAEWVAPLQLTKDDFPEDTDARLVRFYDDFAKVTGRGDYGYTTWTFWPAKTEEYTGSGFDDVLAGTKTVEEYLAQLQKLFDEEKAAGKAPPVPKRAI